MTLFLPNSRFYGSFELFFPIHASNNIIFILCYIFDPVPGGKVSIQSLVRIIEVLIPIIIWRKFGQMLLPAPGWHLLKLRIDELKTEVVFFHLGLAVSHWIDSVPCRRRCRCYLFIYLFVGSFDGPERGGELSFRKLDAIESRNFVMISCCSCWISVKGF